MENLLSLIAFLTLSQAAFQFPCSVISSLLNWNYFLYLHAYPLALRVSRLQQGDLEQPHCLKILSVYGNSLGYSWRETFTGVLRDRRRRPFDKSSSCWPRPVRAIIWSFPHRGTFASVRWAIPTTSSDGGAFIPIPSFSWMTSTSRGPTISATISWSGSRGPTISCSFWSRVGWLNVSFFLKLTKKIFRDANKGANKQIKPFWHSNQPFFCQ